VEDVVGRRGGGGEKRLMQRGGLSGKSSLAIGWNRGGVSVGGKKGGEAGEVN